MTLDLFIFIIFFLFPALALFLSGFMIWCNLRVKSYLKKIQWIEKHEYPGWQKVNLEELLPCLKPYITPSLLKTQQGSDLQNAFELAVNKKKYGKEGWFVDVSNKFPESTIQSNIGVFLNYSSASTAQKLDIISSCIKVYRELIAEESDFITPITSAFRFLLTMMGVLWVVASIVLVCSVNLEYESEFFFIDF